MKRIRFLLMKSSIDPVGERPEGVKILPKLINFSGFRNNESGASWTQLE